MILVTGAAGKTGQAYTILQPAAYMQNVLAQWDRVMDQGLYAVPYAVETRLGMVDLEDVAQVATHRPHRSGTHRRDVRVGRSGGAESDRDCQYDGATAWAHGPRPSCAP